MSQNASRSVWCPCSMKAMVETLELCIWVVCVIAVAHARALPICRQKQVLKNKGCQENYGSRSQRNPAAEMLACAGHLDTLTLFGGTGSPDPDFSTRACRVLRFNLSRAAALVTCSA